MPRSPEVLARRRVYAQKWRAEHPGYYLERQRAYVALNRDAVLAKKKSTYRESREQVLAAYGGACTCCGETQYEFLAIDHVNDDGAAHRREENVNGSKIVLWLIQNHFPSGFQILCHNCNMAKGFYGTCPHKRAFR
jgi:5-methylcytosine-specific restriction endonuclease McrA